ncbi:MAG: flagellar protein FlbB [Treponema sp.]|nr:flagellar protein FlbB [Treponema sp.]
MVGRFIVLFILVAVLVGGGLIWFDYLGVIDAKAIPPVSWFHRLIGTEVRTQPKTAPDEEISLDAERLAIRLEALELRKMEMDTKEQGINSRYNELEQIAQELGDRQIALDELENSLSTESREADNKDRNIEEIALNLIGMPPVQAVSIMAEMDDQDVIDALRKTESIAKAQGRSSIVPYWLSLMDPKRAAELQRKMAVRPLSL